MRNANVPMRIRLPVFFNCSSSSTLRRITTEFHATTSVSRRLHALCGVFRFWVQLFRGGQVLLVRSSTYLGDYAVNRKSLPLQGKLPSSRSRFCRKLTHSVDPKMGCRSVLVEQIVAVLKQVEGGVPAVVVCRQVGISEQTFYR